MKTLQRIIIFGLIWIGCWHMCRVWFNTNWPFWLDFICSFGWALCSFYLNDFKEWLFRDIKIKTS